MNRFSQFARYWIPVLCYAALILLLSSQQNPPGAGQFPDKLVHLVEYALLAALLSRAVLQGRPATLREMAIVVLFCALFAAFDEHIQSYIPGRDPSLYDWLADLTGIGVVITLILLVSFKRKPG